MSWCGAGEIAVSYTHLAAQRGQQAVRLLLENDPPHRLEGERLDIHVVGHRPVGHDGGGVGVDQHHLQACLLYTSK